MSKLSPFTQLTILLTARWAVNGSKPLTNGEMVEIRRALKGVTNGVEALLDGTIDYSLLPIQRERLTSLINRGLGVYQLLDKWLGAGLWVVSWTDAEYPSRFRQLKQRAPALLFGYGNPNAFSERALAIVGSRKANPDRLNLASEIGRACAAHRITVVSGGARGVDSYAMLAGIVEQGTAVGVLADSLLKESSKKRYREAILDGRMCLMSEVHPEARFEVRNAMARNRLAYACADAALVIECDVQKGGTWSGALEALREGKTVYVLRGAKAERELAEQGAICIDASFAVQPERLIKSERPGSEVPVPDQLIRTVRDLLGDPIRPFAELVARFSVNPEAFLNALIHAAVADGVVRKQKPTGQVSQAVKSKGRHAKKRVAEQTVLPGLDSSADTSVEGTCT